MSGDPELGAMLAISRALEQAVGRCEFATALQLQEELRTRIDAFVHARRDDGRSRPLLAELIAANDRVLARAQEARTEVLGALQLLAQRRRAAESYEIAFPLR